MKSKVLRLGFAVSILSLLSICAYAQGRGRGVGLGRKADVFTNGHDARNGRFEGRGPNRNWKCSVFVNCHDARDGRLDGRGPRLSRLSQRNVSVSRGSRVGFQRRYNMNDYWSRRHVTDLRSWRYRNRSLRSR